MAGPLMRQERLSPPEAANAPTYTFGSPTLGLPLVECRLQRRRPGRSRGDIVLLVDGHCEIDNPHYLGNLASAFRRSGADCVGRPQPLDVTGATLLQRAIAAGRSSRLGHHPDSHIYSDREGFVPPQSVAIAYKRKVFDAIGYFDETSSTPAKTWEPQPPSRSGWADLLLHAKRGRSLSAARQPDEVVPPDGEVRPR